MLYVYSVKRFPGHGNADKDIKPHVERQAILKEINIHFSKLG